MFRTTLGWCSVAVLLTLAGCTMCCHPYDNCGPVLDNGCNSCSTHARAGSILDGTPQPVMAETHAESLGNAQAKAHGTARLGYVAGSEKIISVTDRVVKPSTTVGGTSEIAADTATESAKPLPAAGWTARRPAADMQR